MISIIVAAALNNAIGANGKLLYNIKADLVNFKRLTMGHPIVMGRKTFESLPKGALPGRMNIVVTRRSDYKPDGAVVVNSLDEAIRMGEKQGEVFVIGGGEIYAQALPLATLVRMTVVLDEPIEADTFFPRLSPQEWAIIEKTDLMEDEKTGLQYSFVTFGRHKPSSKS